MKIKFFNAKSQSRKDKKAKFIIFFLRAFASVCLCVNSILRFKCSSANRRQGRNGLDNGGRTDNQRRSFNQQRQNRSRRRGEQRQNSVEL